MSLGAAFCLHSLINLIKLLKDLLFFLNAWNSFVFCFFYRNLRKRENVEIRERAISVINQVFFIVNFDIIIFVHS